MKKAIIYCRVSTLKQETNSLIKQELSCRNFCNNNRIQILWIYIEKSSWKEKYRPILDKAINNAIEDKVNYFITYNVDRLSWEYLYFKEIYNVLKENYIELTETKNRI